MSHKKPDSKALPTQRHPRMVARGDGYKIIHTGRRKQVLGDLYIRLLGASWKRMICFMSVIYLILNLLFALLYFSTHSIANAHPDSFADAFFFSVQTFATIGYGYMYPQTLLANLLVTLESMFSFAFYGVVTGLVYAKFSRPTARIMFSHDAIIGPMDHKRFFMLRLANERESRIVDAQAKLTLLRDERTSNGNIMRRSYDLPLVRRDIPILRLTWTIMHEINENSPLYNVTSEQLAQDEAEIIISIKGMDETLSQTIHARHSYIANEIIFNGQFEDVLIRHEDYSLEVRYDKFHSVKVVPAVGLEPTSD